MAKFTVDDLRQRQSLPLADKIELAKRRIREWIDYWDERGVGVYVAFSGGKDSTVLLDLVRQVDPSVPAVFADTGLEYPEIKKFVQDTPNVEIVRPRMTFKQVLDKKGYPVVGRSVAKMLRWFQNPVADNFAARRTCITGIMRDGRKSSREALLPKKYDYLLGVPKETSDALRISFIANSRKPVTELDLLVAAAAPFKISEACCNEMKKGPLHDYGKRTGRKPLVGIQAEESLQRQNSWKKTGCNAYTTREPMSKPLAIWTEQDILAYAVVRGLKLAPVYGDIVGQAGCSMRCTGERRTGCIFCMFGLERELHESGTNRFVRMRSTHPQLWQYCMEQLDLRKVLTFMRQPTGDDQ